jgi:glycosyltransferase involved in cell wall biosynthesis
VVTPRASVIVPVRDRRKLLEDLLDALQRQTVRDFEVVVVDDGSRDGSYQAAEARRSRGLDVTVVQVHGQGAVAARTAGAKVARGEVLAFTDSDCRPDPGWLGAGLNAVEDGAEMVAGRTVPSRPADPLERTVTASTEGLFPTCNVFYRRSAFDDLGGFEAQTAHRNGRRPKGLGFGEDTLLGWAALRSGRAWSYAPEAVVVHHVFEPDIRASIGRAALAFHFPALVREVPELRHTLLRQGFLLGTNQLPFYLAVAAVATRRRRAGALILATWMVLRLASPYHRRVGLGTRVGRAFIQVVVDSVTGSALVAGSVMARTPVL